jgi:hypothetical protein
LLSLLTLALRCGPPLDGSDGNYLPTTSKIPQFVSRPTTKFRTREDHATPPLIPEPTLHRKVRLP